VKRIQSIDDLQPDPKNANQGTERGRGMLEQSLREYGAGRSILVDKEGVVIAGNKTLEVAEELGLPVRVVTTNGGELVVVQRQDLDLGDGDKARRLAYMDNRSSETGLDWDAAQIVADLEADVDLSGLWSDEEIAELVAGVITEEPPEDPGPQIDKAEELREKWQTARGQVWEIGKHRLMCGDSTSKEDVGELMRGEKAGAVVTDPPYGIGYEESKNWAKPDYVKRPVIGDNQPFDFQDIWDETIPIWCVWGANYFMETIPRFKEGNFIVWAKAHSDEENRVFGSAFELCWMYPRHKQEIWFVRRIQMGSEEHGLHVTQKPAEVMRRAFDYHSLELGSLIVDWFLGSGTTMVAAEQTGRICYGMEISPAYIAVTLERMLGLGLIPCLKET